MKQIKIKLFALTAVTALMFSSLPSAVAQSHDSDLRRGEFGIRYMPTFTKLDLRNSKGEVIPGSVSIRQGAGIMLGFNVNKHVGAQAEINYTQLSQKYKDVDINREVKIRYVNIPLLLSLNTDKTKQFNVNFVTGPEFGFNTGADISNSNSAGNDTLTAVVVLKKGNFGLAYGAGFEFALNESHSLRFDIGFRGFYSLNSVTPSNSTSDNSYNAIAKIPRSRMGAYAGFTVQF